MSIIYLTEDGSLITDSLKGNYYSIYFISIEYATSAGHYIKTCIHTEMRKKHKTLWKKAYALKNTIKSKA